MRLPRALIANAQLHHAAYARLAGRLTPQTLGNHIRREHERTAMLDPACRTLSAGARRAPPGAVRRLRAAPRRLRAPPTSQARRTEIARLHERVGVFAIRAQRAFERLLDDRAARVERAERLLAAVSYRGVLARGFALVRDLAGRPLRQAAAVSAGERIDIEFSDGRVRALVEVSAAMRRLPRKALWRRRRRRPSDTEIGQGSLFDL